MKKNILLFIGLLSLLFPFTIKAQEIYVTQSGVSMSVDNYNNLLKIYNANFIDTITQEKYDELMAMNIDFDNLETSVGYFKTTYNMITGESQDFEITEDEYNNYNAQRINPTRVYYETSYKKLSLALSKLNDYTAFVSTTLTWKALPSTRSYDVIAVRLSNVDVINGTQEGFQSYMINGVKNCVSYRWNGTNINNFDNGFGISMNLVNDTVQALSNTIDASLSINGYPFAAFSTYQHATTNVSLATSKSYTIGAGGLGNVLLFSGNIGSNYDGMTGIYTHVNS